MKASLISIGDELISGKRNNTNATFIAGKLNQIGVSVTQIITVGDSLQEISSSYESSKKSQVIIVTGGLGPTSDDRTVECFAKIMQQDLVTDCQHYRYLQSIQSKDSCNPEFFFKQANKPIDFFLETSIKGSAPFLYFLGQQNIFLLPGVPEECQYLLQEKVLPILKKKTSQNYQTVTFKFAEIRELEVQKIIDENLTFQKEKKIFQESIQIGYLPQNGELTVNITYSQNNLEENFFKKILNLLSYNYIGEKDMPLSQYVHLKLQQSNLKIGFIESCTGGLLTHSLIQHAGSSAYLDSSMVTYSNEAKQKLLLMEEELIQKHGAVSPQVAETMAENFLKKRNLDLSVAITGIAGPTTSEEKPLGLVYIAVSNKGQKTIVDKNIFQGSRERIQQRTVTRALFLIWQFLNKK